MKKLFVLINSTVSRLDASRYHHSAETGLLEERRHVDIRTQGSQLNQLMRKEPKRAFFLSRYLRNLKQSRERHSSKE